MAEHQPVSIAQESSPNEVELTSVPQSSPMGIGTVTLTDLSQGPMARVGKVSFPNVAQDHARHVACTPGLFQLLDSTPVTMFPNSKWMQWELIRQHKQTFLSPMARMGKVSIPNVAQEHARHDGTYTGSVPNVGFNRGNDISQSPKDAMGTDTPKQADPSQPNGKNGKGLYP